MNRCGLTAIDPALTDHQRARPSSDIAVGVLYFDPTAVRDKRHPRARTTLPML
jgi:hypothetical protein